MPNVNIENKEKNLIKLIFTVSIEEARPYLIEAAARISEHSEIPGFRPGKADFDIVKQRFGEMKILEEALEPIIRKSFVEAILANKIETVGSPKIDVEKLAPDNDIVFTAEVTRMPKATELADYSTMTVSAKPVEVSDKDIDLTLHDLQRMQTKEVRAENETIVGEKDKVIVSMNIKLDGVGIEGGQSPNHAIYLNEDYYIPGLKDQLIGMKEGEQKQFSLPFPKDHVQKMLAGKTVEIEVKINELYHLEPPTIDDGFAKSLGLKDLADMRNKISENIRLEKEREEQARQEREILELVAKKSRYEDIPDLYLNEEINKMIDELKRNVESQGLEFDTYVSNLKKTLAQLKIEMTPQALTRIKVALAMHAIAEKENIDATVDETDKELDKIAEHYEDKEDKKHVYEPHYREYIEQVIRNRKVIAHLKKLMVK